MKKGRTFATIITVFMVVMLVTACAAPAPALVTPEEPANEATQAPAATVDPNAKVSIIIANGKGELTAKYQAAVDAFILEYPNIQIEQYTGAVGDPVSILDKLTASGTIVTLAMIEPGSVDTKYADFNKVDLSGESWVKDTVFAIKDASGTTVGFPFAIEGFGLIYNAAVVEKAVGGAFDPWSINSRDKLVELLGKIKASGVEFPIAYQTEAWSVGNHYSSMFLNQADDPASIAKQLTEGSLDLASNATWNGYYETMTLLASKDYNKYGERPLGSYYDDAHVSVGKGESAILFNGNWAFDSFQAVSGEQFGFMPVPVDNDPANPMNNKICVGPTQLYVINADATPEQQAAAKLFLNWLVESEFGKNWLVNDCQVISAFTNNPNKVTNPLGGAIADAIAQGRTMPFTTNYVNGADYFNLLGPEVQKFIDQKITLTDLAKVFTDYYKSLS